MRHSRRLSYLVAPLAGLTLATQAGAVILTPGVKTPLPGTTLAAEPDLAGVVLQDVDNSFVLTTSGGTATGFVQSRVVRETSTGDLDFYWRVVSDDSSTADVSYLRLGKFAPVSAYDANWRIDGLGNVAPTDAFLFTSPTPGYVNFSFIQASGGALGPGDSSNFIFLHTTAQSYRLGAFLDVADAGTFHASNEIATFSPGVPEPPVWAMLLMGLAGLAWVGKSARTPLPVEHRARSTRIG